VVDLLDQLQPARLAPGDQVVVVVDGETRVKLKHDSEPLLNVEIVLNDGWVHFYGVMGYDEAYSTRDSPADQWETDTIDTLADLLQADYTIDTYGRQGQRERVVVDIGDPYNVTIRDLRSMLPRPLRRTPVETQHGSFECRNTRPTKTP
jgi:hypothetical protein